jgi:hypothetical protein
MFYTEQVIEHRVARGNLPPAWRLREASMTIKYKNLIWNSISTFLKPVKAFQQFKVKIKLNRQAITILPLNLNK